MTSAVFNFRLNKSSLRLNKNSPTSSNIETPLERLYQTSIQKVGEK